MWRVLARRIFANWKHNKVFHKLHCRLYCHTAEKDHNLGRQDCWPDPTGREQVLVNDISQLNSTKVEGIFHVRSEEDIKHVLQIAERKNISVAVRGTKHSMGGQSISPGYIIDMQYITKLKYNAESNTVTAGSGALWSDVIRLLNSYGKSPRTLQSYSSFSIGGTLAVNGHGITTDFPMIESVKSFRLIDAQGNILHCSRESTNERESTLFRHAIGGYGLFGIIYDVELKVQDNLRLCANHVTVPMDDFLSIYNSVLGTDLQLKLARLDCTTCDSIDIYAFQASSQTPTVSNLPLKPIEMGKVSQLLYKWFIGPMREARFALERSTGTALDWSVVSDRNEMLYHSATSLSRLYSPLVQIDDTFILQEYFIPKENYRMFMQRFRPIVLDKINKETLLTLLNVTIRFVERDNDSALPYSTHPSGMLAFVLYFRIRRTEEGDKLLEKYHQMLVDITLKQKGTFYLPYRAHYSPSQLRQAYPDFDNFAEKKLEFDPESRFSNMWWERYRPQTAVTKRNLTLPDTYKIPSREPNINYKPPEVVTRRSDSFHHLLQDSQLREEFEKGFLVDIFAILPQQELWKMIVTACWKHPNGSDQEIYSALLDSIASRSGIQTQLQGIWRQVSQIASQKSELERETVSVLSRLGKIGKIHDYCSIGDHGKLILPLRQTLGMKGKTWIVHDEFPDDQNIAAVLERGKLDGTDVGEFDFIDYSNIKPGNEEFQSIADSSLDLVTMNQGLHHLPPHSLMYFLSSVHRILRPGGLFIVREHDVEKHENITPVLDCAHMVFNAATGVSVSSEMKEIRAFRSVSEWREIIEAAGFYDSMVYEMQPHDPTWDIMMTFFKSSPDAHPTEVPSPLSPISQEASAVSLREAIQVNPPLAMFDNLPNITLQIGIQVVQNMIDFLPTFKETVVSILQSVLPNLPGLSDSIKKTLDSYVEPLITMLERFRPMTSAARPADVNQNDIIPSEFFLLLTAIRARAKKGNVLESILISHIDEAVSVLSNVSFTVPPVKPPKSSMFALSDTDLDNIVERLQQAFPQWTKLSDVIKAVDLPPHVKKTLLTSHPDPKRIRSWIKSSIDQTGWESVQQAVEDICNSKEVPSLQQILSPGTPWNKALMGVLGSPKVVLSKPNQFLLSTGLGMSDFVQLWRNAQEQRQKELASHATTSSDIQFDECTHSILGNICPVKESLGFEKLEGVLSVLSAELEISSLSGLLSTAILDVTQRVQEQHNTTTGLLRLDKVSLPFNIRAGKRKLRVKYQSVPDTYHGDFTNRVESLVSRMAQSGMIDADARKEAGSNTWYKLPEWYLVESIRLFGKSLSHTPWYKFPFDEMMKTYRKVIESEYSIVSQKYGKSKALLSPGFWAYDLIPFIVTGAVFSQMYALSIPFKSVTTDYYNEASLVEQVLLSAPSNVSWEAYDTLLYRKPLQVAPALWVILVRTFFPLTEFCQKVAQEVPLATIMQISNQNVVQIKIEIASREELSLLSNVSGCKVLFDFQFPSVGATPAVKQAALEVQVPHLLSTIRFCTANNLKVIQVYDFFGN